VIQGNVRNIAKRRAEEAQVRHIESKFLLPREGVKDYAIVLLNAVGYIVSWNAGAERIFGYSEPEVLGQPAELIFTPEDRQNGQPELEMELAFDRGWAEDDRVHLRKDGTRFMASGVLSALRDEQGQVESSGLVGKSRTQLEIKIPEKAHLEFDLAPDLPEIEGDPSQIEKVLMNLSLNAGEALGGGEGTIQVKTGFRSLEEWQQGSRRWGRRDSRRLCLLQSDRHRSRHGGEG